MTMTVWTYAIYLLLSVAVTIWVGRILRRHGGAFLRDQETDHPEMPDAISHLLVVGFYLVNFGMICLTLKFGAEARDVQTVMEAVSTKVGWILVVLGFMHFLILTVLSTMRRSAEIRASRARYERNMLRDVTEKRKAMPVETASNNSGV